MTIPADDSEYTYTGNGSATDFDGPRAFEEDHISVYITDSNGTTSQVTSGYTISRVGDLYNSCLITFDTAPADGVGIDIRRTVPYVQNTSVRNQGVFLPRIHENTFDFIVMMIQQIARTLLHNWRRTLRTPDPIDEIPYTASQRANQLLGFDSQGNPRVFVPVNGSAADVLIKLAAGDGASRIGFKHPLGDSVLRDLLSVESERISVLNYYNHTDSDHSSAFTKAFSATENGEVIVPPGDYFLKEVDIPTGIRVYAKGANFRCSGTDTYIFKLLGDGEVLVETRFLGGSFTGLGVASDTNIAFVNECYQSVVQDACFYGMYRVFSNTTVSSNGWQLSGCRAYQCNQVVYTTIGGINSKVSGCTFMQCEQPIYVNNYGQDDQAEGFALIDSVITHSGASGINTTYAGIYFRCAQYSRISDCIIDRSFINSVEIRDSRWFEVDSKTYIACRGDNGLSEPPETHCIIISGACLYSRFSCRVEYAGSWGVYDISTELVFYDGLNGRANNYAGDVFIASHTVIASNMRLASPTAFHLGYSGSLEWIGGVGGGNREITSNTSIKIIGVRGYDDYPCNFAAANISGGVATQTKNCTVTRTGTGSYTVTFTNTFYIKPFVSVAAVSSTLNVNCRLPAYGAASAEIEVVDSESGDLVDCDISFKAQTNGIAYYTT